MGRLRLLSMGSLAFALAGALACALAGCGAEQQGPVTPDADPAMTEALEGQLLVDPDLSQQNMRNLAVVPPGPVDPARPVADPSPTH